MRREGGVASEKKEKRKNMRAKKNEMSLKLSSRKRNEGRGNKRSPFMGV